MNSETAEIFVQKLTNVLSGRNLVTTAITPMHQGRPEVRVNQEFKKAYFVEYDNGDCVVAIHDSYGVMTGSEDWYIDPDRRTIHAATVNAYDETCRFSWTIADDKTGKLWETMQDMQKWLGRVGRLERNNDD